MEGEERGFFMEKVTPKKIKWLPIILAAVIVVAMLGAGAFLLLKDGVPGSSFVAGADELYWNVDRALYDGLSETGGSSRNRNADGYYHINLANSGEMTEFLTEERKIANALDTMDIFGLEFDENGLIIGYKTFEELGYVNIANRFYVSKIDGTNATINSSIAYDGIEMNIDVTEAVKAYDVSGALGSQSIGMPTKLLFRDRMIALEKDGQLSHVFVFQRSLGSIAWCEHCEMDAVWTSWDDTTSVPAAGGHYILEADIALSAQTRIEANQEIILDLNGHQINGAEGKRVYLMADSSAYLAIFDKSDAKTGKIVGAGTTAEQGGLIWVRYGTFDFYGGTIDGTFMTGNSIGTLIHVHEVASMNMYDGAKLIGGVTRAAMNLTTGKVGGGVGGNLYVDGTFTMYGGIIEGGKAVGYQNPETKAYTNGRGGNISIGAPGRVILAGNAVVKGGSSDLHGGNIYCGGNLTISENAQVYNGKTNTSTANGGNIYISGAGTLNVTGGIIRDGRSMNRGGNVALSGVFNMSGGTITGGQNVDAEGNIRTEYTYVKDHNVVMTGGTAEITGGLIEGYFMTGPNIKSIKISGTAQITGAAEGDINLYLYAGKQIELGELKEGANIGITGGGFLTTETDEANLKYLSLDYEGLDIQYYQNQAFAGIFHCLCGKATGSHIGECKGQSLAWAPWLEQNTLPNKTGNYFLLKDMTLKSQININTVKNEDGVAEKQYVNLDLNGKTVTGADGKRAYLVAADSGSLTITDTHKNPGKIVCNATKDNGMIILSSGKVNIYNGILDGSKINTTGGGGVIRMAGGGELNMYGGQIVGGSANNGGNVVLAANTTNNTVSVFNMYGGTISGGHAKIQAGNVYVGNKCTFNMYGGEILDGTTSTGNGGNVSVTGTSTMNMSGGTISGGFAGDATATAKQESNGGNINVVSSSSLNISGGEILNGKATNRGGNIRCDGKMTMSGGKITGGLNTDVEGVAREGFTYYRDHNVLVPGNLDMSGGLIEGYVLLSNAKNTYKISGTAQVTGGERNIYLADNVLLEVGQMEEGANVGITMNAGGGVFSKTGAPAGSEKYFVSDAGSDISITDDGQLFIGKYHCLCGVTHDKNSTICDGTKHIWSPLDGSTNITASGYYYLVDSGKADDGITEAKSVIQVGGPSARDLDVVLDMNGLDYESSARAFQIWHGAEMTIYNSKETGGTITGAGANKGHTGVILLSNYDTTTQKTDQTAVLNLIDVNVAVGETENVITEGGAIKVTAGCTLNVQGGTITGGTVTGNGGTIYVEGGDLVLNDATVIGGTANNGGAICVAYDGTVTMNGTTTVSGGTAKSDGGNIYIGGGAATVTMNDTSSVFGGREDKNQGGNLSSRGILNMNDEAQIYGGLAGTANRNVRLYGGSVTMTGNAAIDGGVTMSGKTNITLSDTVRIAKLDKDGNVTLGSTNDYRGLYMGASVVIDATGIKEGAQIAVGVDKEVNFAEVAANADEKILTCFLGTEKAFGTASAAVVDGEKTYVIFEEVGGVYHCLCGNVHSTKEENGTLTYKYGEGKCLGTCDGTILSWSPWDGVGVPSGNVYLTQSKTDNMVITGGSFNLDLNGFNIEFVGERKAIAIAGGKGTINISNSSDEESRIYGVDTRAKQNGGVIALTADYTLNLYNVNVEAEQQGASVKDGGAVYISNGTFSMYGGSVKGIKASGNGGAIYNSSTKEVILKDVAVSGGTANWGGNIYAKAGTTLTLNGTTTVKDGHDDNQGSNIYSQGILNITDEVEISGGSFNNGSNRNLRMENPSTTAVAELHVSGNAYIDGGVTVNNLKALTLTGTPTICQIGETGNPLNAAGLRNLRILNGPVIDATGLEAGALISVGVDVGTTFAKLADDATADIAACFMATENANGGAVSMETVEGEKVLVMRPAGTEVHCVCGSSTNEHMGECTGEQLLWTVWDGTVGNGNYYLTSDHTSTILINDKNVTSFNLDLHGYDIRVTNTKRAINIGSGSITFCDTVGGSIIAANNSSNGNTISQWADNPTSIILYGVDLEAHNGGSTVTNGGIAYILGANATFKMYGGTITGCTVGDKGGAMAIVGGATVKLEDVTIAGGTSNNGYGDAIYLNNGTLTLGGTIVSNEIYIGSNTASKIVIDEDFNTADSEIWVDMATVTMPIATDVAQDYSAAFKSNKVGYIVVTEGTQLKLAEGKQTIEHCLCGSTTGTHLGTCDGTVLTWEPWDGSTDNPGNGKNVYLTQNKKSRLLANGVGFNLDLNGYSIEHIGAVAPVAKASGTQVVNITNSSDKVSRIYGCDNRGDKSGGAVTVTTGTVNLYNVHVEAATDSTMKEGGAINVSSTGNFNMYGGSIKGRAVSGNGGAMFINSANTITLKNVAITGGDASLGGAIYAKGGADLVLENVDITVTGKEVTHGGGIYVIDAGTTLEMTDCTVAGTHVVGRGGCLAVVGGANATLKNVTMNGGDCDKTNKGDEYGKDLYLNDTITLDGTVKIGELCMGDAANAKILIGANFDTTDSYIGISRISPTKPLITDLETDLSANFGSTDSAYVTAYDAPNKQLVLQAAAAREKMNLRYDDRVELNATSVQITAQNATSYAVGTTTKDAAVLTYTDGTLIATGVGTAVLSVDGTHYDVTVEAAPISLFMITGHSVGEGSAGDAAQSVVVEAGQAYSSHVHASDHNKSHDLNDTTVYGLGYGAANRVQNNSDISIDGFAAGNGGTRGEDSGLAYRWTQLTGEKVWVINCAVGGSALSQWTAGAAFYNYAVNEYKFAQKVLTAEVAAGHYILKDMAIIYHSAANASNFADTTQTYMNQCYVDMWNGYKTELSTDITGDGQPETVQLLGLVPIWTANGGYGYSSLDKAANYLWAASKEHPDVFMASLEGRKWLTTADVLANFPAIDYTTQSEPVAQPESAIHKDMGGTSENSVFCAADVVHYAQVGYNAQGMVIAGNLYDQLRGTVTLSSLKLMDTADNELAETVTLKVGQTMTIVPVVEPITVNDLEFVVSGSISVDPAWVIKADAVGTGTITVSHNGQVLKTITVTVEE